MATTFAFHQDSVVGIDLGTTRISVHVVDTATWAVVALQIDVKERTMHSCVYFPEDGKDIVVGSRATKYVKARPKSTVTSKNHVSIFIIYLIYKLPTFPRDCINLFAMFH